LLPGDRFVLRESGRDETVGGGEVLDIEPVLRASRAAPDRTIERVVRERGWVTVDDVERLTGQRVEPTVGGWVTTGDELAAMRTALVDRVAGAGVLGVDLASFDDRERAVLATLDEVVVDASSVRPPTSSTRSSTIRISTPRGRAGSLRRNPTTSTVPRTPRTRAPRSCGRT
jgi:selenocysteine-specific elongation factor